MNAGGRKKCARGPLLASQITSLWINRLFCVYVCVQTLEVQIGQNQHSGTMWVLFYWPWPALWFSWTRVWLHYLLILLPECVCVCRVIMLGWCWNHKKDHLRWQPALASSQCPLCFSHDLCVSTPAADLLKTLHVGSATKENLNFFSSLALQWNNTPCWISVEMTVVETKN
jgi:hypothetical protein